MTYQMTYLMTYLLDGNKSVDNFMIKVGGIVIC